MAWPAYSSRTRRSPSASGGCASSTPIGATSSERHEMQRAAFQRPFVQRSRRRPTLPGGCPPSTIGAGGLNCSVRNGKRCTPAAITAENCQARVHPQNSIAAPTCSKSRPRAISTGPLNALLRLHVPPIDVVVYHGPYSLEGMGGLILRWASRLDAFSGYPIQAWLI